MSARASDLSGRETVSLAHISDLHLGGLRELGRLRDLLGKRALGVLNLLGPRRGAHPFVVAEALVADLLDQGPDHVVVTGDLSNLSLAGEFRRVAELLAPLGDQSRLSMVPGNHDRYTRAAARLGSFEKTFAPWLRSDLEGHGIGPGPGDPYPWVKLLGPVALIGLCSADPRPGLFSRGRVGPVQQKRVQALLARAQLEGRCLVVCLHHPLLNRPRRFFHQTRALADDAQLLGLLLASRVAMVLHGHNHLVHSETLSRAARRGGDGQVERAGAASELEVRTATSTTLVKGSEPRLARYATYEISASGVQSQHWRCWDPRRKAWVGEELRSNRVAAPGPISLCARR